MIGLESAWKSHVLVLFSIGILNSTYCLWKMCGEGVEAFLVWIQGHANVLVKYTKTMFFWAKTPGSPLTAVTSRWCLSQANFP